MTKFFPPDGIPFIWLDEERTGNIIISGCFDSRSGCFKNSFGSINIVSENGDGTITLDCSRLVITGETLLIGGVSADFIDNSTNLESDSTAMVPSVFSIKEYIKTVVK